MSIEGESEYIGTSKILTIDEAKQLKKVTGKRGEELERDPRRIRCKGSHIPFRI